MSLNIYNPRPRIKHKPMLTCFNGKLAIVVRYYIDDKDWRWRLRYFDDDLNMSGECYLAKETELKLKELPNPDSF